MPGTTAVGGLKKPSTGSLKLVVILPRPLSHFPKRCVEHVRSREIHLDVGTARVLVHGKNVQPSLPAVGRAKDASLIIRTVRMPEHCGEQPIRVAWVNRERGYLLPVTQAEMGPRFARVCGLIYSVADR